MGGAAGGAIAGLTFGASLVGSAGATGAAVAGSTAGTTAATVYTPAVVGAVSGGVQQVTLNVENGKAPGDGVFAAASMNGVAAGVAGPILGAAVDRFLPGLLPIAPAAGGSVAQGAAAEVRSVATSACGVCKHPITIVTIDNIAAYLASNPFVANAATSTANDIKAARENTSQSTGMTRALGAATEGANKQGNPDHQ